MQFSKTFIVEDSEPMVRHNLGCLLREAGYKLLPDGRYQRGTREGSMLNFDPVKWHTRVLADSRSTPDYYTRVILSYDVQTAGQALKSHIRRFWVDEVDRIVAGLNGKVEGDQDMLRHAIGLEVGQSADPDISQAGRQDYRSSAQLLYQHQRENQMKNGANWFFWIAGLSLINTITYLLNANLSFIVGLGATQVVDVVATMLIEELPEALSFLRAAALLINLVIMAIFVGLGWAGRKGKGWAFIMGMGLYFLDSVIFLMVGDWFAVLFHVIALYGLLRGYLAFRELHKLSVEQVIG
jgi:hypothetical protein